MVCVKDMEMPNACEECCLEQPQDDYDIDFLCPLIYKGYTHRVRKTGRLKDCPLVEVEE